MTSGSMGIERAMLPHGAIRVAMLLKRAACGGRHPIFETGPTTATRVACTRSFAYLAVDAASAELTGWYFGSSKPLPEKSGNATSSGESRTFLDLSIVGSSDQHSEMFPRSDCLDYLDDIPASLRPDSWPSAV